MQFEIPVETIGENLTATKHRFLKRTYRYHKTTGEKGVGAVKTGGAKMVSQTSSCSEMEVWYEGHEKNPT